MSKAAELAALISTGGFLPTGWSAALDGTDMVFIYNSVEVFKITTAGAVVAKDDVTAFGTP